MARKGNRDNKMTREAKKMPPLFHTRPNEEFSRQKSEVMNWIRNNEVIIQHIFDTLSINGHIEYDSVTGKWQGVEYED